MYVWWLVKYLSSAATLVIEMYYDQPRFQFLRAWCFYLYGIIVVGTIKLSLSFDRGIWIQCLDDLCSTLIYFVFLTLFLLPNND